MKTSFLFFFILFPLSLALSQSANKTELFCRKWILVGSKPFIKPYKEVHPQMAKVMQFTKSGFYEEEMFNLKSKGMWEFNGDSTMFKVALTEFNGMPVQGLSMKDSKPTDRILKLTKDSLIIGAEAYFGPDKIFGHDDSFFVPFKQ